MKQLTCEMCGSTDLLKQDGVFVCQSCGMKYSVEDAKKMMIEGTVEVQGTVQIKNTAQLDNLLRLAQSSYASKNYAQAEEFCNQVIAMDANNYEAWKLKGEAINFQITGKNDRITEVYNCIMTSYSVLDEEGQEEHSEEILTSLRECLEGEIDFALDLFKSNRPSDSMLKKVKNTFISCASNVITSYEKLGYSEKEADEYRTYIKNYFIKKANAICDSTWDDVVYHNYYRGGFDDDYHPNAEIMMTYINEGDNLIALLRFAEQYFTPKTPLVDKRENYKLQNVFQRNIANAASYKRMVSTTTNGYGAVTSRREYWAVDKTLTAAAKEARNKEVNRTCALFDQTETEIAKSDPASRKRMLEQWNRDINAIDLSYKLPVGGIVAIILCLIAAAMFYLCFPSIQVFGTIMAVIFVVLAVIFAVVAHVQAKNKQAANQAKVDRLQKKIQEIS